MKIDVINDDKNLRVPFPTWLGLNRLTCGYISKKLKKHNVQIKKRQLLKLMKLCKKYKKKHKDWTLLEVDTVSGTKVIIKI